MMRISNCEFRIANFFLRITVTTITGLLMSGCVTRSLTIKTNPADAMVYVNDQLKGKTPVTYDFTWYGWHRVMIRKEGYKRVDDRKMLRAPSYLWIPADLVMELLPFRIHDNRVWEYTLLPQADQVPLPPQLFTKPAAQGAPTRAPTQPAVSVPAAVPPEQEPARDVTRAINELTTFSAPQAAAADPASAKPEKREWLK